jgi:hypothetical protein
MDMMLLFLTAEANSLSFREEAKFIAPGQSAPGA